MVIVPYFFKKPEPERDEQDSIVVQNTVVKIQANNKLYDMLRYDSYDNFFAENLKINTETIDIDE